jgi:hypothetical protein
MTEGRLSKRFCSCCFAIRSGFRYHLPALNEGTVMKQAIALLFLSFGFVFIIFCSLPNGGVANAGGVCPSPTPSCTSSGSNQGDLSGTFACSQVETHSDSTVKVAVSLITADGSGNITLLQAGNSNQTSPTTFQDFATLTGISYCVNTDDTGYLFPPGGGGCPLAFIIDNGNGTAHSEVRLMDSTENRAVLLTCKKQ